MSSDPVVLPASRCPHCGQTLPKSEEWKQRRFRWGLLLAVLTFLPFGIAIGDSLRYISASKTTGLGAVAGGLSELYVTFGMAALVVAAVFGIVFLVRGFSAANPIRVVGTVLGAAWCGFVLVSALASVALLLFLRARHP